MTLPGRQGGNGFSPATLSGAACGSISSKESSKKGCNQSPLSCPVTAFPWMKYRAMRMNSPPRALSIPEAAVRCKITKPQEGLSRVKMKKNGPVEPKNPEALPPTTPAN